MIRCKGGVLYTGITTNITRRFSEHQAGKGAKFLRGKTPLKLVFQHVVDTHSQALKLELWVKKQSKTNKERIIQQGLPADTKT